MIASSPCSQNFPPGGRQNLQRDGRRRASRFVASVAAVAMLVIAVVMFVATPLLACLITDCPVGAIKYDPAEAIILHGSEETFDKRNPILLPGITPNDASAWFNSSVTQLTTLRGYAHAGRGAGNTQQSANRQVMLIQIWGWRDTNGDGQADAKDRNKVWVKLLELKPMQNNGDGSGGNVVGWDIPTLAAAIQTSTWRGDLLQGRTLQLQPGRSWLLLIRVVDLMGNTNLMDVPGGLEKWWDGTEDGAGSGVEGDQYVDFSGNTPGTNDQRIKSRHVAWTYSPLLW